MTQPVNHISIVPQPHAREAVAMPMVELKQRMYRYGCIWLLQMLMAVSSLQAAPTTVQQQARVVYKAANLLYINLGWREGVRSRQSATLLRRGRSVGGCTIALVADHTAVCTGPEGEVGDAVTIVTLPREDATAPRSTLPTVPANPNALLSAVTKVPFRKVHYDAKQDLGLQRLLAQSSQGFVLEHRSWLPNASNEAAYHRHAFDFWAQDIPLGRLPLHGDVAAQIDVWSSRPDDARYRSGDDFAFALQQFEVSSRASGTNWVASFGRLHPWYLPGLYTFDGTQVGVRLAHGRAEAGGYFGFLPDLVTLAPSADGWVSGVYVAGQSEPAAPSSWRYELRAGMQAAAQREAAMETQALLAGGYRDWWFSTVELRSVLWSSSQSKPTVAMASWDALLTPNRYWRSQSSVRYLDDQIAEISELVNDGSLHLDEVVTLMPMTNFEVVGLAGLAESTLATNQRTYWGSEVHFLNLLARRCNLNLGTQLGYGWLDDFVLYAQPVIRLAHGVQLLTRISYSLDTILDETSSQLAGLANLQVPLFKRTQLATAWQVVANNGADIGITGNINLNGSF